MLEAIGVGSVDALFANVEQKHRLQRPLAVPAAASEQELVAELGALAARNAHQGSHDWFLGAGCYAHFIPAAVDAIASRAEFYTAYTPYQAEISQGTLQAIFEWQTMICGLTGLEVSNASMYDGASAAAEAALMAMRITKRTKVVLSSSVHPHYQEVIRSYLAGLEAQIALVPRAPDGRSSPLAGAVDSETACVVLQQPNFLGAIEDVAAAAAAAHAHGAKLVVVVGEALSLALLRAPGSLGADIVCGEAQSFGVPMSLGGPNLGFMAARMANVRNLPGRLVGQTVDSEGRRGFVLTLSTREQHIRRERATSNICTNQGLCLLMATVYLALLGRVGLRRLAERNLAKAEYAKARVRATPALRLPLTAPTFNEFVVGVRGSAAAALERALEAGSVGGLDLAAYAPELGPALLVCTTELATREAIDRLVAALAGGRS
jgi:glycine dehydrogenase subunit 1